MHSVVPTPATAPRGRTSLPVAGRPVVGLPVTGLVGREGDLLHGQAYLQSHRLVTLTGFGGVGKSRLARELALRAPAGVAVDGTWMVELEAVTRDADVAETVILGLKLTAGRGSAVETLADFVAERTMLLVIDNCEHRLAGCRELVSALLGAAPGLTVLATSREPLGIFGEQVVDVPPLTLPTGARHLEAARRSEAMQLFELRAREVNATFAIDDSNLAAAVDLCVRLDGLPLALELAAARVRTFDLPQLLAGLGDRFGLLSRGDPTATPHHRTLRAMVEWSYELCTADERRLWRQLSVFVGGADLAAVTRVCRLDVGSESIVDVLDALVGKSIVRVVTSPVGPRFATLETIREHGRGQLDSSGDTASLRSRHAEHFLDVAHGFEAGFFGPDQVVWGRRVQVERPNVLAAFELILAERVDGGRAAVELASALRMAWMTGSGRVGRHCLERALAAYPVPSRTRVVGLCALAMVTGYRATGRESIAEATVIGADFHLDDLEDRVLAARATSALQHGDPARAIELGREASARSAALGHSEYTMIATSVVALAAAQLGSPEARGLAQEMIESCQAIGDVWFRSWGYHHLALEARTRGDVPAALDAGSRSLLLAHESDNRSGMGLVLIVLAWAALRRGKDVTAGRLLGGAAELADEAGVPSAVLLGPRGRRLVDEVTDDARTRLGQERFDHAVTVGRALDRVALVELAASLRDTPVSGRGALTVRELEVVRGVVRGQTNRLIADDLGLSGRTVEGHVERIRAKLGLRRRTDLAAWGARELHDPDEE